MSRTFFLFLISASLVLRACRDADSGSPSSFESSVEVKLHLLPSQKEIDWNFEFTTFDSEEVLGKAATLAGTDEETLDQSTTIEADPEVCRIRITARHEDEETSRKFADSLAAAFNEVREKREKESGLEEQARLAKEREEIWKLMESGSSGGPGEGADLLNRDQMTYEKAKKALEENFIPDDGVLYRKEDQE